LRHLFCARRGAHLDEEPPRLGELEAAGGCVAGELRQPGALDVDEGQVGTRPVCSTSAVTS